MGKTGRKLFQYEENQLREAIKAVKNETAVSTAAKTFNIPRSTLRHKIKGEVPDSFGKVGKECVLGKEVENELMQCLKISSRMGFPIDRDGLLYSVKVKETNLETPFKNNIPGKKWFR